MTTGTQASDSRRLLRLMDEAKRDWAFDANGDLVTRFECERVLGLNDGVENDS